jgi:hypothetical protein
MKTVTLKTLVLKTVTASSVKLLVPADRIGLGRMAGVAAYPMDFLSPGQFPLPHNPEPENGAGSRQGPSSMHEHEMATAAAPAGSAGCLNVPGSVSVGSVWSFTALPLAGWRGASKRASRAKPPASAGRNVRIGRDCQSPDRKDDRLADARRDQRSLRRSRGARVVARACTTAGK